MLRACLVRGYDPLESHRLEAEIELSLLYTGAKCLRNTVESSSVRPVVDAGNVSILVAMRDGCSRCRASSDQRFLIQESRTLAGRARARYRRRVAAIIFGEDTFAESGLRAGLDMMTGGLNGFFHQLSINSKAFAECSTPIRSLAGKMGGTLSSQQVRRTGSRWSMLGALVLLACSGHASYRSVPCAESWSRLEIASNI